MSNFSPFGPDYDPTWLWIPAADNRHEPNRKTIRFTVPGTLSDEVNGFIKVSDVLHPWTESNALWRTAAVHGLHHLSTQIGSAQLRNIALQLMAERAIFNQLALAEVNRATVDAARDRERTLRSPQDRQGFAEYLHEQTVRHPDSWVRDELGAILRRVQ